MTSDFRSVLISGASKGIGHTTAIYLAERSFSVFAGYRSESDRAALAALSDRITPVRLDVTDGASVVEAVRVVRDANDGTLDGLVNNAGIVEPGPLEALQLSVLRHQFDVNVFGLLGLTQECLPLLRASRGRIVNVSSINGRIALPFNGPYAGSKFAVEALSDVLRLELHEAGVKVSVVQPGAVESHIWQTAWESAVENLRNLRPDAAGHYAGLAERVAAHGPRQPARAIPAERVARCVFRALTLRRPKLRYVVGWDATAGAVAKWLLPQRLLDALIRMRKQRSGSRKPTKLG